MAWLQGNTMVMGYLVTNDEARNHIHNKPDKSIGTTNLDVGFICSKGVFGMLVERLGVIQIL